jgi:DNA-binding LytR/AlgR family response regulator
VRILLIEDELPASRQLTKLIVAARPNFNIVQTLDSVEGSVKWLCAEPAPDLIFMDIQIADGLSFDIFRQVSVQSPVIFTTAFDQYALQAFKVNALDYLLKPVAQEDLQEAIVKFEKQQIKSGIDPAILLQLLQKDGYKERFLVKTGQYLVSLPSTDIAYFKSADGLTQAYTFSGKKHFIDHTLEELEKLLDPRQYFRVSRSLSIRVNAIQKIHPHLNGRLKLEVVANQQDDLFVSRDRANDFKAWLS